jgi:hypothetical protein
MFDLTKGIANDANDSNTQSYFAGNEIKIDYKTQEPKFEQYSPRSESLGQT